MINEADPWPQDDPDGPSPSVAMQIGAALLLFALIVVALIGLAKILGVMDV